MEKNQNTTVFSYKNVSKNSFYSKSPKKKSGKKAWKVFWISFCSVAFLAIIGGAIWLQMNVLSGLPDVSQVKDMIFSQATTITDRNGVELYKVYEENREYVDYDQISPEMVDALVAIEDQRYWEHEGLDPWGIFRAAITGKGGASTLPQQLMTNVFDLKSNLGDAKTPFGQLLNKVAYKLRQIVLSKRLNAVLKKQIKAEQPSLSSEEIKHEMKKKILELYLNYIPFGNNAFGIEAASKTYFGIPAKDLSVVQASILAGLPRGQSYYNPYGGEESRTRLVGSFSVKDGAGKDYPFEGLLKQEALSKFRTTLQQADFSSKSDAASMVKLLAGLGSFTVNVDGKDYYVKYTNGRKDLILARMLEDGYLDQTEFISALSSGLDPQFQKNRISIKAPHFVFWVMDELEKQYGAEALHNGGMTVKTTLDYEIQKMAEQALVANATMLTQNGANNSSLIYTNPVNGEVLAYVGSLDYFNEQIQGQNDMVRRPRQSGSSIKPLIYAFGFEKLPLTIDTPILDYPYHVGSYAPNNADGKFEGMLPLKAALGHSRNIPAVKMFVAAGGEEVVKPYLQSLGLSGIVNSVNYGAPLALGAGEVSMLELANAYQHLAVSKPGVINPVLEITSPTGSLLYERENQEQEEIIKPGIKSLLWSILSEPANRLAGWVSKFNVSGLTYALKTGTSNVETEKGSRPRDGWVAAYTPQAVVLLWAGNTNAAPMNRNAFGGTIHADTIKSFLGGLLSHNYITNQSVPTTETANVSISRISGKLAADTTPSDLVVSSQGYTYNLPKEVESPIASVDYDALCLGQLSPMTPYEQQRHGYLVTPASFMPGQNDLEDLKKYFTDSAKVDPQSSGGNVTLSKYSILIEAPQNYCDARTPQQDDSIQISFLSPQNGWAVSTKPNVFYSIKSPSSIVRATVDLDGKVINTYNYGPSSTEFIDSKNIDISGTSPGEHTISVSAINKDGKTNTSSILVIVTDKDKEAPYLAVDQSSVKKSADGAYDARLVFIDDLSAVVDGKILDGGKTLTTFDGRLVNFTTPSSKVSVELKDAFGNVLKQDIDLANFGKTSGE